MKTHYRATTHLSGLALCGRRVDPNFNTRRRADVQCKRCCKLVGIDAKERADRLEFLAKRLLVSVEFYARGRASEKGPLEAQTTLLVLDPLRHRLGL